MTRSMRANMVWGAALILIGLFLLLVNVDVLPEFSGNGWAVLFGLAGLAFIGGYVFSGIKNWPLLFPGVGSLAIAITIWLGESGADGEWIGALFMLMLSIPFWVAALVGRRQNWWALIPAFAMSGIAAIIILSANVSGEFIGALVMLIIAAPFLAVYLMNRKHWWALIPAYSTSVIAVIILLSTSVRGEFIGAFVMFAIAFPFLVVFLYDRKNAWAIIPAGIMGGIGLIVLLAGFAQEDLIGAFVLLVIAAPFYFVFLRNNENWWALIPAGVMTTLALVTYFAAQGVEEGREERFIGGLLFAGLAATFGLVWLLRRGPETEWAKYPAVGLFLVAILVSVFSIDTNLIWAVGLIVFGVWLLYRGTRPAEKSPKDFPQPDFEVPEKQVDSEQ